MENETILWAVKIGEPDYNEQIITTNASQIEKAKQWATANKYNRFRIQTYTAYEKPNFINTVNK